MNAARNGQIQRLVKIAIVLMVITNFPDPTSLRAQSKPENLTLQSRPLYMAIESSLDSLSRAEIAREEAFLAENRKAALDTARQQCRAAIQQLLKLDAQVVELLRTTYGIRPSQRKNTWTVKELESLARNLKVQLARGYRNQSLCYAEGSIDRINALSLALKQLAKVTKQPLADASIWQARIEQVLCLRLNKSTNQAKQLLRNWQTESPPTDVASRLLGEQIRIALDEHDLQQALKLADQATNQSVVTPETAEAVLQTWLEAQRLASPTRAAELLRRAHSQTKLIAKQHGPYWQRRAESHFGQAMLSQLDAQDPVLLGYAAKTLYIAGRPKQAIAVYDRIAALHDLQQQEKQRFESLKTAATIAHKHQQHDLALQRFRKLAKDHSQHNDAPALHLIAINLATKAVRESSEANQAAAFELYLELLHEHLEQWPSRSTAERVRTWLVETEHSDITRQRALSKAESGQRAQAIALYRRLISESSDDPKALEKLARLLAASSDHTEMQEALKIHTQIEKRSKPGGPRWMRNRRARSDLLEQLGKNEKAKQLRELTKVLYPAAVP